MNAALLTHDHDQLLAACRGLFDLFEDEHFDRLDGLISSLFETADGNRDPAVVALYMCATLGMNVVAQAIRDSDPNPDEDADHDDCNA